MHILSLDTSTKNLSLAVSREEKILKQRNMLLRRPLSSSIIPGIQRILKNAGLTLVQLDGFAVGLGPGSFTSLRVGLSTVKGLAFATGKPVVGIASLDILAMNVADEDSRICVLCDARRDLVYACIYEKHNGTLDRKSDYMLASIEDVLKDLRGSVVFIGDGITIYRKTIEQNKKINARFADVKHPFPQARQLAALALPRFREKVYDHIDQMVPLYLYPDHCQIRPTDRNEKAVKSG